MPTAPAVFVGIDVSKHQLDVAVRPQGATWTVSHDEAGLAELVARLQALGPALIVLEATGGLEIALTSAVAAAGLPGSPAVAYTANGDVYRSDNPAGMTSLWVHVGNIFSGPATPSTTTTFGVLKTKYR